MLKQAHHQGRVIVIVLPVSPLYTREFLSPGAAAKFEATLTEAQRSAPEASWVHLEQLPDLKSNDYFCGSCTPECWRTADRDRSVPQSIATTFCF